MLVFMTTSNWSLSELQERYAIVSVMAHLSFFLTQVLLIRRLVTKRYCCFRVTISRDDGASGQTLSFRESIRVALSVLWPQVVFLLVVSSFIHWQRSNLDERAVMGFSSVSLWSRFLFVGPYAVALALRKKYSAFRLQAYGQRYI
jgi:hypothetical protein